MIKKEDKTEYGKMGKKYNSYDKGKSREVQMEECFSEHATLIMTVKMSVIRQVLFATEKSSSTLDSSRLGDERSKIRQPVFHSTHKIIDPTQNWFKLSKYFKNTG